MNCIIVDDDKVSCKILEKFISDYPSLDLVGTFNSSPEARNLLTERKDIELVFLDIMMPEMDGFDFLHSLDFPPNIIMVSSNEKFAVRAFDYNAADYLLKPVSYGRFCKAVDKIFRYFTRTEVHKIEEKEIFVKNGTSLIKLKIKDIIYIEALENYVNINTATNRYTVHFTMKAIANLIPSNTFVRIQRSYIVNKNMIQTITDSTVDLNIENSVLCLPLGKSFRNNLLKEINLMSRQHPQL